MGTEFWPPIGGYRLKITDTLLAVFTFLLFLATGALFLATRALVKGAELSSKIELRAYVFVEGVNQIQARSSDASLVDNLRIGIALKNGGKTPTKKLRVSINWDSFDEPLEDDFNFPDRIGIEPMSGPIGPGAVSHTPHVDIPLPLMELVARGHKFVYIWGWADYDDVVGGAGRHRSEFCFEFLNDGRLTSFHEFRLFNGYDEECHRAPSAYKA